jgi:hypothetical protein
VDQVQNDTALDSTASALVLFMIAELDGPPTGCRAALAEFEVLVGCAAKV